MMLLRVSRKHKHCVLNKGNVWAYTWPTVIYHQKGLSVPFTKCLVFHMSHNHEGNTR